MAFAGVRAHAREIAFVLKLLPMLPSGPIDRVTRRPIVERVRYPTGRGEVEADLYRPPGRGPHPAIVLCLGVVPFGVDHPQVARLSDALARAGFVALIHWSDTMRDLRLAPEDADDIASAYAWLLERDDVDRRRSGLFGTCVGGSFALLAAARPLVRDRVMFVGAFAPFSSMWTLACDVATGTCDDGEGARSWEVDELTRKVFARTLESLATTSGAPMLPEGCDRQTVEAALHALPQQTRERLDAMSPILHVADIHAPCIVFGHDRDDAVIPVGESRRLAAALEGRRGVLFTEYAMFQHADPTQRKLSPLAFAREVVRFYGSLYPMFGATT